LFSPCFEFPHSFCKFSEDGSHYASTGVPKIIIKLIFIISSRETIYFVNSTLFLYFFLVIYWWWIIWGCYRFWNNQRTLFSTVNWKICKRGKILVCCKVLLPKFVSNDWVKSRYPN
jgi:hypothetical protein